MCAASQGASSAALPVSMFTTPAGRSEVASTSVREIAGSGPRSAATTTQVLPVTMTGATTETSPRSDDSCGASTATTPVGSGTEKSKNDPATDSRNRAPGRSCRSTRRTRPTGRSPRRRPSPRCASAGRQLEPLLRRTALAAPRASRRCGTGSARGCMRSRPTTSRTRPSRQRPRRARPCATRAQRWRGTCRARR